MGIHDGIEGLIAGDVHPMTWSDVTGWVAQGGAFLGTKRTLPTPENLPIIAEQLKKFGIQALLVIGGFEAFHTVLMMSESRNHFPAFCMPLVVIPATISEYRKCLQFSSGNAVVTY